MLFTWTIYSLKNPWQKKNILQRVQKKPYNLSNVFDNQISMLEWFVKDQVILKTGVMADEILLYDDIVIIIMMI